MKRKYTWGAKAFIAFIMIVNVVSLSFAVWYLISIEV